MRENGQRIRKLLVANRGEIAVRIVRSALEAHVETVAVFSRQDAGARHVAMASEAYDLGGEGAGPYLDAAGLVAAAVATNCDALHPGYGFLSESASLALACAQAGVTFVGPSADTLALLGDKAAARRFAAACGTPIIAGSEGPVSLEDAGAFFAGLPSGRAMMLKAVGGGGGRGVRVVRRPEELDDAFARCASEAQRSFGVADVYVEEMAPHARHIEVQILGDAVGEVAHLWDRDCSLQRRFQKIVEVAPAPAMPTGLRTRLIGAALRLARELNYENVGTVEFLVDAAGPVGDDSAFWFIEANPRLQVEHTVTEEVTGVDIVRLQLALASGATLAELGLRENEVSPPKGYAIEVRLNAETMGRDGEVRPSSGVLEAFQPPSGPGVRLDTAIEAGSEVTPAFDSLIAKLITRSHAGATFADAVEKASRALSEFTIRGVSTNAAFLRSVLALPEVGAGDLSTTLVQEHLA